MEHQAESWITSKTLIDSLKFYVFLSYFETANILLERKINILTRAYITENRNMAMYINEDKRREAEFYFH